MRYLGLKTTMSLIPGTKIGRYKIVASLGKGGMGEVYRARDTQLDRDVAMKVLPEHLAQDTLALKRFQRETKAIASVSHPNILAIHDSGEHEGIAFAVMELLEGETLRERLKLSAIPVSKALEITAAISDGLAAAHAKGVVHRDLKPENLFLQRDGGVKILDFGLARQANPNTAADVAEAPTQSQITGLGIVLGTVAYMSPEQIRAENLDARTDIFSLGCILYEMIAGKRPFSGKTTTELGAAILRDQPEKLPGVPQEIQRIIDRCLEKDRNHRFHSAHDLSFAIKDRLDSTREASKVVIPVQSNRKIRIAAAIAAVLALLVAGAWISFARWQSTHTETGLPHIRSLAVLPLENLTGDPSQEYFADGMTEELIAKLARISSLRVISRTSVMEYKNARKSLPEIGKELNVDAIVEGSIFQAGNRVRITAQLIHASTDQHLWADRYERDLADILALQNDVASAIAKEVQVQLAPNEALQLTSAQQVNPTAYEAYLRGLNYANAFITPDNLKMAVTMFEKAVDLDPQFATAYAELSKSNSFLYLTIDHSPERLAQAKKALDRAFELDPELAEGHHALASYYYFGFRDYERALRELMIAKRTLPNNISILVKEGAIYRRQGKLKESLEPFRKAFAIDPRNGQTAADIGVVYSQMRNYPEAQRYFDLSIALAPDGENGYMFSCRNILRWKGNIPQARAILSKAPETKNIFMAEERFWLEFYERKYDKALEALSNPFYEPIRKSIYEGLVYQKLNRPEPVRASLEKARRLIEEKFRKRPNDVELTGNLALVYAGLGRKEEAIRKAKEAIQILPVSKDAFFGMFYVERLAHVYVLTGEYDAAIAQLQYLLSVPSPMSANLLAIDPRWDPIRSDVRFQKLLQKS